MGSERLRSLFAEARRNNRPVFMPFLTAGLPGPTTSPALFDALAAAGADAFEVGLPYSDPLMDGPVIHEASTRALAAGTRLDQAIEVVRVVAATTRLPVLAMGYVNPIVRAGPVEFTGRLAAAGADGLIVADLPLEEAGPIRTAASAAGLGLVLFAAPTTDDARLGALVAADPVFLYCVADLGVTGERSASGSRAAELVARVRSQSADLPLVLGVGISTPDQAADAARMADGVIVGSALVRRVLEASPGADLPADLGRAAAGFAEAVHTARA